MLQALDLSSLAITELTVQLQTLDFLAGGLLHLDLSSNSLRDLPRSVGMCASLQVLKLASNMLSSLPSSTKQMKTLTHLDISGRLVGKSFPCKYSLNPSDHGSLGRK